MSMNKMEQQMPHGIHRIAMIRSRMVSARPQGPEGVQKGWPADGSCRPPSCICKLASARAGPPSRPSNPTALRRRQLRAGSRRSNNGGQGLARCTCREAGREAVDRSECRGRRARGVSKPSQRPDKARARAAACHKTPRPAAASHAAVLLVKVQLLIAIFFVAIAERVPITPVAAGWLRSSGLPLSANMQPFT